MSYDRCLKKTSAPRARSWIISVCLTVLTATTAWADIAPDPLSGGKNLVVKGREATKVAMVDEVVKLKLSKDVCDVEVVFTMKNTGTKPETMQVGFPHDYKGELTKFQASINGTTASVKNVEEEYYVGTPDDPRRKAKRIAYWKLWEMTFAPEKPVKITVSYSTKLRPRSTWMVGSHSISNTLCELVPKDDRDALETQLASRHVEYILITGGHWSGPIGRCRIEITFHGMTTDNLELDSPHFKKDQATITSDKIVWDLKNYEPKEDVRLTFTPNINRKETLALLEKFRKPRPYDPILTEMLVVYLIALDRQPEADKIMLELLRHWQNKIAIWGPESEQGRTLSQSANLFSFVRNRALGKSSPYSNRQPVPFRNPAEFAPVIEQIANRLKGQLQAVPPGKAKWAENYAEDIDQLLAWSRKHAKAE